MNAETWYEQMKRNSKELVKRFKNNKPKNETEAAVFETVKLLFWAAYRALKVRLKYAF